MKTNGGWTNRDLIDSLFTNSAASRQAKRQAILSELDTPRAFNDVLHMIKTITKIGNSHGIIFDSALLQLARLKPGDTVNVEVHAGGTITLTPMEANLSVEEVMPLIAETMEEYRITMQNLAK